MSTSPNNYDNAIEAESKAKEQVKSFRKAITNAIGPKSKKDAKDPKMQSHG
jgi:hypothetical protein